MRFRTGYPYLLAISDVRYDLEESVYVKVEEVFPVDTPETLVKHAVTISWHGANLCTSVISGRSVAGVLYVVRKNPVEWH